MPTLVTGAFGCIGSWVDDVAQACMAASTSTLDRARVYNLTASPPASRTWCA
jgi:hypothetical protein